MVKTQNTKPSGSNRPHVTVVKTQNTKPSGSNRLHVTVVKTQNTKPSGLNRPHGNVATNKPSGQTNLTATWQLNKPSGKPDLTVVELIYDRWIKPTSRHRGNPNVLQYITEPNIRYNMVHHLITSNSMSLLMCALPNVTVS